jgi:pSer/pThr/pTyr-binding forkhead associated (FHA) protein
MRLENGQPSRGSGIPLRELRADARELEAEAFDDRHGRAYLLLSAADLARPQGTTSTEVRLSSDAPGRDSTVGLSLLVYPVRRNGRSAGHLITIGRSADNDVVVPDVSISRFHAFVKEGAHGEWLIHDAGSTNGTTVNGNSVPRQGHGSPVQLKSGDDVRLGQVDLTFLDAEALRSFAQQLVR